MKYLLIIICFLFSVNINSQNITAYLYTNIFDSPEGPYIEQQFALLSESIEWKQSDEGYKANIELTYIFKKDSQIVKFTKEKFSSDLVKSTLEKPEFLLNFQRIPLDNGEYDIEIKIDDLNDTAGVLTDYSKVTVNIPKDKISLSSIQSVESFKKTEKTNKLSKGGYDLNPYPINFYPKKRNDLILYSEIYNTNKILGENTSYLAVYYLKNSESNQVLSNYKSFKKKTAKEVDVMINKFDISKLPTGKFYYVLEIRDKENKLLASKNYYFTRSNPEIVPDINNISSINVNETFVSGIKNIDTLGLVISSLAPISSGFDQIFAERLIEEGNLHTMQQYLLQFWTERNPKNPEEAFNKYMENVSKVEKFYKTSIKHGFETDRGRVYLKYGAPNVISENYNEPNNLPYEVWQFYKVDNQSNLKFVFYAPDRSTNDFNLIHSTALGEVSNYRWRYFVGNKDNSFESIDDRGDRNDKWGSQLNRTYNNPR